MVPQARGREFRCASIRWAISISPASAVATNRTSAPPIRSANCCAKRLLPLRAPPRMRMIRAMKLWALNDSLEFDLNALAAWGDQVQPRGHGQLAERSQQSRDRAAMRHGDGQALPRQFPEPLKHTIPHLERRLSAARAISARFGNDLEHGVTVLAMELVPRPQFPSAEITLAERVATMRRQAQSLTQVLSQEPCPQKAAMHHPIDWNGGERFDQVPTASFADRAELDIALAITKAAVTVGHRGMSNEDQAGLHESGPHGCFLAAAAKSTTTWLTYPTQPRQSPVMPPNFRSTR